MADINNVRNYLSNVSRNVWLALGLVVIAVLLAVSFLYGDTEDLANQNGHTGDVTGEHATDGEDNDETAAGEATQDRDGEGSGEAAGEEDGDGNDSMVSTGAEVSQLPRELADTGPIAPVLAISALAMTGYMYRRSRTELRDKQSK